MTDDDEEKKRRMMDELISPAETALIDQRHAEVRGKLLDLVARYREDLDLIAAHDRKVTRVETSGLMAVELMMLNPGNIQLTFLLAVAIDELARAGRDDQAGGEA